MRLAAGLLTFAFVLACEPARAQSDIDAKPALDAAEAWLAALDTGRYGASWEDAAPMFRETTPRVQWETTVERTRAPLGVVISRKVRQAVYRRGISTDPDADVFVIQYDTRFENRPLSTEIVTPLRGADGAWRVSAYVLR
jgi:hypothetical protein